MKKHSYRPAGSIVAQITPFENGRIDEASFRRLVEFQIKNGTAALLPCGTTGESATLSHDEHRRVVELSIQFAAGRVPVIAGTGSNSTAEALELTEHAAEAGADAALLICPYYNKPTQRGLIEHFVHIADRVDLPQILYNIPGRTGVNMLPETIVELAKHPRIVGVKEASGNIGQITQLMGLLSRASGAARDFSVVSGDDGLTYSIMALGGTGVISAAANLVPKPISRLVRAMRAGRITEARRIQFELLDLIDALFIETNPIPVKTACALLGLCRAEFRLPMCPMSPANLARLKKALRKSHVLR
ncbi:4-hydroxy-tetrahydrodipicolinate synthase [bacterium]|nr:4-hydroxy-tetrahydrodipicolinate synthase [bacterium]